MRFHHKPVVIVILLTMLSVILWVNGAAFSAEVVPPQTDSDQTVGAMLPRQFLPIAVNGLQPRPRTDSIFGTQMYNDSRPSSQFYDSLVESHASWMRIAINWSLVEPNNVSPDNYAWGSVDRALNAARTDSAHVHVLGTIETAPSWAVASPFKPDGPLLSSSVPDFVEFVAATVERYDGDGFKDAPGSPIVTQWELYNEPDRSYLATDGRWGDDGDKYAAMLKQVYPAVKAANPSAQIVLGGLAYDFFTDQGGPFVREFLDDVIAAGGGQYFDIFNYHTYPAFAANWYPAGAVRGPGLLQKGEFLRGKLNAAGLNKPFIVTEAGWHSNDSPNMPASPTIQAAYVIQLFAQSYAADLDYMIWWMLYDPGDGGLDNGLVTGDATPVRKQSFFVYRHMVDTMKDADFIRPLSPGELDSSAQEAYLFARNGADYYIAWQNPVTSTTTSTLHLPAARVTVRDMVGQIVSVINDSDDGNQDNRVKVTLSNTPVYIEVMP